MSLGRRIRAGAAYVELSVTDSKFVAGLKAAQRHLKNFGSASTALGGSMLRLGAVAAAPFAGAVKVMTGFSDQMAAVRAITGANAQDFARLESKAKELGATTSFSARQVADGMQFLGMAGFNTEQILAGIPAVLNLARAGAIDLGMAADIASDVGSAFGLSADQIVRVADVMAKTATSSNTNIEMMGETLKYAAPLAAAAGQSIEDTATAIGIMGNSGIKASMAGTDLALIFKLMGDEAQAALRKLGVETVDAQGNMRSVIDVMEDLGKATAGFSESEKLKFFATNFDRAAKSAIILSTAGTGMRDLQTKINGASGSAAKMAAIMEDTTGGSFRSLMSAVEGAAIAIGDALAPTIREWAGQLTKVAQWLQMAGQKNQAFLLGVVKAIGIVAAVGAGLVVLGTLASSLGAIFGTIAGVIGAVGTALGTVGAILAVIVSPIGIVTGAVVALGIAFGGFGDMAGTVLDWVMQKFGELGAEASMIFNAIRDALASGNFELAARVLWLGLQLQWQKGVAFLRKAWADFGTAFMRIATDAFYGVAAVLNNVWAGLQVAFLETTQFFSNAWSKFASFVLSSWNKVSGAVRKAWAKVKGVVAGTDSEAEIKRIESETKQANLQIEAETKATLKEREAERQRKRGQIEQDREGTNRELIGKADQINAERDAAAQKAVLDAQAAVEKARDELAASIEETKQPTKAGGDEGPQTDGGKLPTMQELIDAAGGGMRQMQERAGANVGASLGTDEGTKAILEALRGGGPAPEAETAKNTAAIANGVQKMQKEQEETNRHLSKSRVSVKRA